jgi:transcriptional regulator with XRE-family HTH domain
MSFADVIRKAREDKKVTVDRSMSRQELAEKLEVTATYLGQLENGSVKSASVAFLKRYADETDVPIQTLTDQIGK